MQYQTESTPGLARELELNSANWSPSIGVAYREFQRRPSFEWEDCGQHLSRALCNVIDRVQQGFEPGQSKDPFFVVLNAVRLAGLHLGGDIVADEIHQALVSFITLDAERWGDGASALRWLQGEAFAVLNQLSPRLYTEQLSELVFDHRFSQTRDGTPYTTEISNSLRVLSDRKKDSLWTDTSALEVVQTLLRSEIAIFKALQDELSEELSKPQSPTGVALLGMARSCLYSAINLSGQFSELCRNDSQVLSEIDQLIEYIGDIAICSLQGGGENSVLRRTPDGKVSLGALNDNLREELSQIAWVALASLFDGNPLIRDGLDERAQVLEKRVIEIFGFDSERGFARRSRLPEQYFLYAIKSDAQSDSVKQQLWYTLEGFSRESSFPPTIGAGLASVVAVSRNSNAVEENTISTAEKSSLLTEAFNGRSQGYRLLFHLDRAMTSRLFR